MRRWRDRVSKVGEGRDHRRALELLSWQLAVWRGQPRGARTGGQGDITPYPRGETEEIPCPVQKGRPREGATARPLVLQEPSSHPPQGSRSVG